MTAALLSPGLVDAQRPVAMVTDAKAPCEVSGQAGRADCEILQELAVGATIILSRGAELKFVYLAGGSEYFARGPAEFVIAESAPVARHGPEISKRHAGGLPNGKLIAPPRRHAAATLVMRGNRQVELGRLRPRNSTVRGPDVHFTWRSANPDLTFELILKDDAGGIVHIAKTSETELTLAHDERLEPGRYYRWTVTAFAGTRPVGERRASFQMMDQETRAALARLAEHARDSFSGKVHYAAALASAGVVDEAHSLWQELAAARPSEPRLTRAAGR